MPDRQQNACQCQLLRLYGRGPGLQIQVLPRIDATHRALAAGINITFRLEQLLNLRDKRGAVMRQPAASVATCAFAQLLADTSSAFEELYVAAFEVLDRRWLDAQASYMQFPAVLDGTMSDLQRVLHERPQTIQAVRAALTLD